MGSGDLIQRGWKGLPSFFVAWCRVFKVMYMFQMSQEIVSSWIKLFRSTYSNIVFSHYAAKIYMEFEIAAVRLRTQSGFHVWLVVCWENMTRLKPCPKILLKHFCSLHCQNKCIRFSFSSWKKGAFSALSNSYFLWIAICRYQSLEKSELKSISLEFLVHTADVWYTFLQSTFISVVEPITLCHFSWHDIGR